MTRHTRYTTGELIGMCVIVAMFVAMLTFATTRDLIGMNAHASNVNTCPAPCVVTFDNNMTEDGFDIDYHNGELHVWRVDDIDP